LVAVACETLAAARKERSQPEKILAEALPPNWGPLVRRLFDAIRNGLAHGFDTKHIVVDAIRHQVYMQCEGTVSVEIIHSAGGILLCIRPRILAELICVKIDELKKLLRRDAAARKIWFDKVHRHKREAQLETKEEKTAWKSLI
jgi:hypothetical protein